MKKPYLDPNILWRNGFQQSQKKKGLYYKKYPNNIVGWIDNRTPTVRFWATIDYEPFIEDYKFVKEESGKISEPKSITEPEFPYTPKDEDKSTKLGIIG